MAATSKQLDQLREHLRMLLDNSIPLDSLGRIALTPDTVREVIAALTPPAQSSGPGEVEALDGYRAAVSFISGDAWDGCSDCMEVLRAARCADWQWDWGNDSNRIAANLARIRTHMPALTLNAIKFQPGAASSGEGTS